MGTTNWPSISSTRAPPKSTITPKLAPTESRRFFSEPGRKIRISTLALLEIQSAFAMKVRRGVIDREAAGMQRARLMLDIASAAVEVYRVTNDHFTESERLIGRHSFFRRLRTLDALQLSVALDLAYQDLLDFLLLPTEH